jgi:C-22 sterol desaturase
MLMIGKASMMLDWDHKVTDLSEEIKVFATIFPMVSQTGRHTQPQHTNVYQDDCLLTFKKRTAA